MGRVRDLRLIPVVLLATVSLAVLKLMGLLLDGGYLLTDIDVAATDRPTRVENGAATAADNKTPIPQSASSQASRMLGYADVTRATAAEGEAKHGARQNTEREVTGNSPEAPAKPAPQPEKPPDGTVIPLDAKPAPSPSERAILEHLQERRQELDARAREIELRENLLKAGEKKYESRANEQRDQEANASSAEAQKKEQAEVARFKNIVTMYENMKAKDAARIFDRLEMRILVEVASQINPRRMSDILGQMSPEAAERLTVELANRATASGDHSVDAGNLPKIEGVPKN